MIKSVKSLIKGAFKAIRSKFFPKKAVDPRLIEKEREAVFQYFNTYMQSIPLDEKGKKLALEYSHYPRPRGVFREKQLKHFSDMKQIEHERSLIKRAAIRKKMENYTNSLSIEDLDFYIEVLKKARGSEKNTVTK